jgi:YD repeat-containing protein
VLQTTTNLQSLTSAAETTSYTYNPAGNITSASDVQNTGGTENPVLHLQQPRRADDRVD